MKTLLNVMTHLLCLSEVWEIASARSLDSIVSRALKEPSNASPTSHALRGSMRDHATDHEMQLTRK
eukprot:6473033-Amphidinium_carterae.1